jgi:hypothetical protein
MTCDHVWSSGRPPLVLRLDLDTIRGLDSPEPAGPLALLGTGPC